ncbi:MAG TPA: SPFH domain-containing protein [Herpetosiphonaceae bacterium]|nr:SPFH domain-containing protein [Herpetosiphonaceae bacterium]
MAFILFGVTGLIVLLLLIGMLWATRYVKVGPNEALIISGRKYVAQDGIERHYRIVTGGATFVWPVIEKVDRLNLENITLDIVTPEFYTRLGVPIKVEAVAQIKVRGDEVSIGTAAEQFLSKSLEEIKSITYQMMAGHLRAMLGTLTVEDIMTAHESFAQKVQEVSANDLSNMGLTVVSFTIREISDSNGYLQALGRPQIAAIKKDATIGEAEANRDATIMSADAIRQGQLAKIAADTQIAEANRDFKIRQAEHDASVNQRKAETDLAYDLQRYKTAQSVTAEEVQVDLVRKQRETEVQQQETLRREQELNATIRKPAEAERERQILLAEAEAINLKRVAEGKAESIQRVGVAEAETQKARGLAEAETQKARGLAEADVRRAGGLAEAEAIRAQGLAEAEAVRAKALAEAEGMLQRAHAWQQYNQAAIAQMLIEKLPEIVRAANEPLSRIDRITLVNTGGNGGGSGLGALQQEMAKILASTPELIGTLTGIDLQKIIGNLGERLEAGSDPAPAAATNGAAKTAVPAVIEMPEVVVRPEGAAS